jgi:hypothetical protein
MRFLEYLNEMRKFPKCSTCKNFTDKFDQRRKGNCKKFPDKLIGPNTEICVKGFEKK